MKTAITFLFLIIGSSLWAQSNLMEGNNNFAMYTKSNDFKQLEAARKFADGAYQTRRDSVGFRNNLLRGLVYSTLAVVDSNRTQKYPADPIDIALGALNRLSKAAPQTLYDNDAEIRYIRRSLANAYLIKANRAVNSDKYEEALANYKKVDSLGANVYDVKHNLAVLSTKNGNLDEAINRYEKLLTEEDKETDPLYIIELAELYFNKKDRQRGLNTLLTGREKFPEDKLILFQLINTYVSSNAYNAVIPLIPEALAHEPENVKLNFIAAYSHENTGDRERAKHYYEKVIRLDPNNFEGNFELGLLYLKDYMNNTKSNSIKNKAQEYLLKANQIQPSAINTLKSLAVLYDKSGDIIQLERVNNILNQRVIN